MFFVGPSLIVFDRLSGLKEEEWSIANNQQRRVHRMQDMPEVLNGRRDFFPRQKMPD